MSSIMSAHPILCASPQCLCMQTSRTPQRRSVRTLLPGISVSTHSHSARYIQPCSALTGDGLVEGLEWLNKTLRYRDHHRGCAGLASWLRIHAHVHVHVVHVRVALRLERCSRGEGKLEADETSGETARRRAYVCVPPPLKRDMDGERRIVALRRRTMNGNGNGKANRQAAESAVALSLPSPLRARTHSHL